MSDFDQFYVLEGHALERLRERLAGADVRTLRLEFRRDGLAYKVNSGMWSPTVGTTEPRE